MDGKGQSKKILALNCSFRARLFSVKKTIYYLYEVQTRVVLTCDAVAFRDK